MTPLLSGNYRKHRIFSDESRDTKEGLHQGNFIEGNLLQTLYSLRKVWVHFIWYIRIPVLLNLSNKLRVTQWLLSSTQFSTLVLSRLRFWETWVILLRQKLKKQQSNKISRSERTGVFLRWRYPVSELLSEKLR